MIHKTIVYKRTPTSQSDCCTFFNVNSFKMIGAYFKCTCTFCRWIVSLWFRLLLGTPNQRKLYISTRCYLVLTNNNNQIEISNRCANILNNELWLWMNKYRQWLSFGLESVPCSFFFFFFLSSPLFLYSITFIQWFERAQPVRPTKDTSFSN